VAFQRREDDLDLVEVGVARPKLGSGLGRGNGDVHIRQRHMRAASVQSGSDGANLLPVGAILLNPR
jgi:hypothetical protein